MSSSRPIRRIGVIGTGVIGGMLSATILAIFFVPVFCELVSRRLRRRAT